MKNLQEIEAFLYRTHARSIKNVQKNMTLERMWPLLEMVDNPQEKLHVIHVAGTSGKTSTSYFISEILALSHVHVGLTVSPHILKITERLQINSKPVSDEQFVELFNKFVHYFDPATLDATYFELMMVFVLWAFAEIGVDVAVVETGLGGMHDGTNVCRRKDKCCVITEIGYDHQDVLGDTLEEIASQKAGIIHTGNMAFMYKKDPSIQQVFDARITEVHANKQLVEVPELNELDKDLSLFQQRNWHLAFEVASHYLLQHKGIVIDRSTMFNLATKKVPGRLQKIVTKTQTFYLDGAHNTQKAQALVESLKPLIQTKKIPIILAVKKGKDSRGFLEEIKSVASKIVCTEYTARQDIPVSSISADLLAEQARNLGVTVEVAPTIEDAVALLFDQKEPVVLITGSLYGLGQATRAIEQIQSV